MIPHGPRAHGRMKQAELRSVACLSRRIHRGPTLFEGCMNSAGIPDSGDPSRSTRTRTTGPLRRRASYAWGRLRPRRTNRHRRVLGLGSGVRDGSVEEPSKHPAFPAVPDGPRAPRRFSAFWARHRISLPAAARERYSWVTCSVGSAFGSGWPSPSCSPR
jgi:hypothetical protein